MIAILAVGDSSMADAINCADFTAPALQCYIPEGENVKMPAPVVRRYHSRTKGNAQSTDATRAITFTVRIMSNVSSDLVWGKVHAFRKKFRQARRAYGAGSALLGTGVSFWYADHANAQITYFDVLDGEIEITKRDFGAVWAIEAQVTLQCLPLGRGPSTALTVSGTITNGANGSYWLGVTIPGDDDAICQVLLTDTSPSGAINRVHIGRRSLDGMQSSDFTPVLLAGAAGSATHTTGDATSMGSAYYSVVPNYVAQDLALYPSTGGALNHGSMDVFVRLRDHTAFVSAPINLMAVGSSAAGSLSAASNLTYTFQVAEKDAIGSIGPWSDPVSYFLKAGETEIILTWTIEGTPSGHEVQVNWYSSGSLAGTEYISTGSTAATYTLTAVTITGASPAVSVIAPVSCQLGIATGNAGSTLPNAQYRWNDPFTTKVGGDSYELCYAGQFHAPPCGAQEGQPSQPYQYKLQVQVQPLATVAAAIDTDGLYQIPHDEPQCIARYPGLINSTKLQWLIDTRRDERVSCTLLSGGVVVQQAICEGAFFLGPGGNLLVISVDGENGIHDITSTYTVQVIYAPRYADPAAVGT